MAKKKLRDMTISELRNMCKKTTCHSCDFYSVETGCPLGFPPRWIMFIDCEIEDEENDKER